MLTLTLSASKLEKLLCPWRYYSYAILKRRPAGPSPGADAGSCVHAAWAVLNRQAMGGAGAPLTGPDEVLATERTARPLAMRGEKPDYCDLPYLREVFAVLRAEWGSFLGEWRVLEVERRDTRELARLTRGDLSDTMHPHWYKLLQDDGVSRSEVVAINLEYVRDVVLEHRTTGEIWIVDLKTASEERRPEVLAYETSDQFKGYLAMWNDEHPDLPAAGVQPVQLIMRKPLAPSDKPRKGTALPRFMVKFCPPLRWSNEFLDEWRRSVLDRAAGILRRNPDDPSDWPLTGVSGTCHGPWGTCGYLPTCRLTPASRLTHLSTDLYEHSDTGKEPVSTPTPQPLPA